MFECQNILPRADMNGDYAYTITDLWLQLKTVFLLPANALVDFMRASPGLGDFLELNCWSGHGFIGGVASTVLWLVAIALVGAALALPGRYTKK
jgi:hypothetical protein